MPTAELDNIERLALAKLAIEKGDYESALLKLKVVVSEDNPITESLLVMARLNATLRLFPQSQAFYQRFLEQVSDSILAQFEYGMTYYDQGDISTALSSWQAVLQLNANHPPALFYSALCHANRGESIDAKAHLDTLLSTAVTDNTYFQRGRELSMNLTSVSDEQTSSSNLAELMSTDDDIKH